MLVQKWNKFIPQQFVAVGKTERCVTFQCTNKEADEIMRVVEAEFVGKVWVVDCKTPTSAIGWMQAESATAVYSLSFENEADYHNFLRKFAT